MKDENYKKNIVANKSFSGIFPPTQYIKYIKDNKKRGGKIKPENAVKVLKYSFVHHHQIIRKKNKRYRNLRFGGDDIRIKELLLSCHSYKF
jgi:hypothetical protein